MDAQAFEVVTLVIPFLEERGFEYVLVGGWAAYAYGTRVASADTDVFIPDAQAVEVNDLVSRELGVSTGPGGRFETLSMRRLNRILGTDWELDDADRGYVPAELLKGHVRRASFEIAGIQFEANVPEPREFALTKLKALHDRELAYRAVRDPAVRSRIPPSDWGEILEKTEGYYAGKAGKDLFDAAYMFAHHVDVERVLARCDQFGFRADVEPSLRAPDRDVRGVALGLATDERTRRWIEEGTS